MSVYFLRCFEPISVTASSVWSVCCVARARHVLGGSDCLSFSAFSTSSTTSVYRKREQRTLNLVWTVPLASSVFLTRAVLASGRLAIAKKFLISVT